MLDCPADEHKRSHCARMQVEGPQRASTDPRRHLFTAFTPSEHGSQYILDYGEAMQHQVMRRCTAAKRFLKSLSHCILIVGGIGRPNCTAPLEILQGCHPYTLLLLHSDEHYPRLTRCSDGACKGRRLLSWHEWVAIRHWLCGHEIPGVLKCRGTPMPVLSCSCLAMEGFVTGHLQHPIPPFSVINGSACCSEKSCFGMPALLHAVGHMVTFARIDNGHIP